MPNLDTDRDLFRNKQPLHPIEVRLPGLPPELFIQNCDCEIRDRKIIFQGDIILEKAPLIRLPSGVQGAFRTLGYGYKQRDRLWKDGIIRFGYQSDIKDKCLEAIEHWQERTPLRFVQRTASDNDFVFFRADGGGNYSGVGFRPGVNPVFILPSASLGTVIHEIGHVIGLWHENARPDYAEHIKIIEENIDPRSIEQFRPIPGLVPLGPYDIGSIMHYPSDAFSIEEGLKTITKLDNSEIGPRNGLSVGDIASIREMYNDLNWSGY